MTNDPTLVEAAVEDLSAPPEQGRRIRLRPSTGVYLLLGLSLALTPLGFIGVRAAIQAYSSAERERASLLEVSTREMANNISQFLRLNVAVVERAQRITPSSAPIDRQCANMLGLFGQDSGNAPHVQIVDSLTGRDLCTSGVPADMDAAGRPPGTVRINRDRSGITHTVSRIGSSGQLEVVYPVAHLTRIVGGQDTSLFDRLAVVTATRELALHGEGGSALHDSDIVNRAAVGRSGLTVVSASDSSILSRRNGLLTLAIPVGMWLIAVLLSWLIVDS